MPWSLAIDVVLVLGLLAALGNGVRTGLLRTAGALIGCIAGGVAAFFVMPWAMALPFTPELRVAATLIAGLVLLAVGASLGEIVGRTVSSGAKAVHLGWLDRILGGVVGLVVTAFVMLLIGGSVAVMGIPGLSPAVAGSWVVRTLDALAPPPARSLLAGIRQAAGEQALPWLAEVLDVPEIAPETPDFDVDDPEVLAARASVVRISGTAFRCGVGLTGSGFVVAPDRIVTNAHVVAGVAEPVVEAPGHAAEAGRVVAFDPANDLAVIAVDGFDVPALPLAEPLTTGAAAVVAGYPFGGPLDLAAASVVASGPVRILVDGAEAERDVVTVAARVEHGNSGGPLLTMDGAVAGVVFARSDTVPGVGFAIAPSLLAPLAAEAPGLSSTVSTGGCTG